MKNPSIQLVAVDLDGTLLRNDSTVSAKDYQTFIELGKQNICRVVATGRALYFIEKALGTDFPIDYVILATGAGIYNWKTKELIQTYSLESEQVKFLSDMMRSLQLPFGIYQPVPLTHLSWFYNPNSDEEAKTMLLRYHAFASEIDFETFTYPKATQFKVVLAEDDIQTFDLLKEKCKDFSTTRATPSGDTDNIWFEVFHPEVSKGKGLKTLCEHLGIALSKTLSIGNDYNDIDLLEASAYGFMLDNAPEKLKLRFNKNVQTLSNMQNGFTHVVEMFTKRESHS